MKYRPDHSLYSIFPLYFLITVFYLAIIKIIHNYRKTHAVYSRSYLLLILSAVFGYSEVILSILYGYFILKNYDITSPGITLLSLCIVFLNENYFISTFLTVFRVVNLVKLNNGLFNTKNSILIRNRLKTQWNLKAILIYSLITTSLRLLIYIIYESHSINLTLYNNIQGLIMLCQIIFDSSIFLLYILYIIKSNCDITLRIQYTLYIITWGGAYMIFERDEVAIFLLVIPIRNIAMELLSIVSVYEHDKHFIIPLPDVIDLDFILRSEFFVRKFREVFNLHTDRRREMEFEILLSICVYNESKLEIDKKELEIKLKKYKRILNKSFSFVDYEGEFDLEQIYSDLYVEFETGFLVEFMKTSEFNVMKIEYSSS